MKKSVLLTPLALAIGLGATYIPLRSQGTPTACPLQALPVQTAPAQRAEPEAGVRGTDARRRAQGQCRLRRRDRRGGPAEPWGFSFLPGGRVIVTEKPGRLRIVAADGTLSEPITGLPPVDARGQGGLLDVAIDPEFPTNQLIYWSYAEPQGDGTNNTAVARGKLVTDGAPRVDNVQVIFHQAPSLNSQQHYGSRLVFGRDGTLFVTLGERSVLPGRVQAQDLAGLIGKIVRINADGTIPKDNPFVGKDGVRPEIWSYGHRNVQGAALHPTTGELWSIEHGPRGGDELNIPRKGKDYGWPTITYGIEYQRPADRRQPHGQGRHGAAGLLLGSGHCARRHDVLHRRAVPRLAGQPLHRRDGRQAPRAPDALRRSRRRRGAPAHRSANRAERIRDVGQGPDGALYFITDNAKGRLMKIVPKK